MLLLVCTMMCTTSCELFEDDISFGHPHIYSGGRYGSRTDTVADSTQTMPVKLLDTVIYVSAVRMPEKYDWRRDTAYGAVEAELVLLRNFEEIVSIPVGPHVSSDADRHHIYNGHLYTERQYSTSTYIGCNGQDILKIDSREELRGILEQDGVLYMVTAPIGKEGFTFRANGAILMMKGNGSVFGSLLTPSYRPGGALYMDNGKCCFCFISGGSSYKVEDGVETIIKSVPAGVHDVRIVDGREITADENFRGIGLSDARIWPLTEGYAISGTGESGMPTIYRSKENSVRALPMTNAQAIYMNSEHAFAINCTRDGKVSFADARRYHEVEGSWYFFSPACGTIGPSGLAMVLTPKEAGKKPIVRYNGKDTEININGFLTGIDIEIEEK